MLLYMSSSLDEYLGRVLDHRIDFPGDIALETTNDVALAHSLRGATTHIRLGPRVMAQSDYDYAMESGVGLAVASAIESVSIGLAR